MTPEGFTYIEEAPAKWPGRSRAWWYTMVKEGALIGYKFPMGRGTYLKDVEVEAYLRTPRATNATDDGAAGGTQTA